ncbi:GFA family protein [Tahibacter soli]|uniref:GFA family protein n=1 Tax=Tahibacter soli TaxID=2983605 RepID=A0A9X3YJ20_9GAMM|nr:GFA family protein [Tahibacter soli]MDC8013284.1 GFA family protein [Tahibacter soli]
MSTSTDIACACGDVRVRLEGAPDIAFYCHCDDCQAVSGGAYVSVALFPKSAVTVLRGTLETWKLRALPRHRCARCGIQVFAEVTAFDQIGVNGARLPPGVSKPAFHIQCRYAVNPVVDDLPHYADAPTDFGGSGNTIGW